MKIETQPQAGDSLPLDLYEAHEVGSVVNSDGKLPCSICRGVYESGSTIIVRDHFHGSDLGACARKVYQLMKTGIRGHSSNACFLADGHLHEHSMLSNLIAGLGNGWKIKKMENASENRLNILGFDLIGHTDALLYNDDTCYLIECKSVKDYNFKKVKSGEISNEWYGQIQAYLLLLELQTAYLLVKHRETSKMLLPIRIERDNVFIAKRLNVLADIHTRIVFGMRQPSREHKSSKDSECKFCPFKEDCWGIEVGEDDAE